MPAKEEWVTGPGNREFYTKSWVPAEYSAVVVFVHGFVEHISRYDDAFDRMSIRGIATFAYDQRGFGKTAQKDSSQGITSWKKGMEDLTFFLKRTAEGLAKGKPLFLFGHSMGGGLSTAYVTRQPPLDGVKLLSGVIVSAPLIELPAAVRPNALTLRAGSIIGAMLPSLQLSTGVPAGNICRDEKVNEAYAADPLCAPIGSYKGVSDMLLGGPKLVQDVKRWPKKLPVFVYHGTGDKVTAFDAAKRMFDNIDAEDKTFKAWEGYYHECHNEPGDLKWAVIDENEKWIKAHVKQA